MDRAEQRWRCGLANGKVSVGGPLAVGRSHHAAGKVQDELSCLCGRTDAGAGTSPRTGRLAGARVLRLFSGALTARCSTTCLSCMTLTATHTHLTTAGSRETKTPTARSEDAAVEEPVPGLIDSTATSAAFLRDGRLDVSASSPLGRALHAPIFDRPSSEGALPNLASSCFLCAALHGARPRTWEETADFPPPQTRLRGGRGLDSRLTRGRSEHLHG